MLEGLHRMMSLHHRRLLTDSSLLLRMELDSNLRFSRGTKASKQRADKFSDVTEGSGDFYDQVAIACSSLVAIKVQVD